MHITVRLTFIVVLGLMLIGCSMTVPTEEVYGTYVATYPFGTDKITLNRDGTFVQRVEVKDEQPVTVQGRWEFDPKESQASFYGAMIMRTRCP